MPAAFSCLQVSSYNPLEMESRDVQIRPATAGDADALSAFAAATFALGGRQGADPAHLAAYIESELTPQRLRRMMEEPAAKILLAQFNSRIAGYASLINGSRHPLVAADRPSELQKLYVHPEFHGSGIADRLMGEALCRVEKGCDAVWLSVYSENPRAIAFYSRWKFRVVGTHHFLVGDDAQKDLVMRRDLQDSAEERI
jgi:diamine N-acetyltransferase